MNKIKVGIIGTGNIGTDLLIKIQRSQYLECAIFTGRNYDSDGIRLAKSMGINTSVESIGAIAKNPESCEIVFDATSAVGHRHNAPILKDLGKFAIDLTPAQIGKFCVPVINMEECIEKVNNVNLITCGGQATIPIAYAITKVHPDTKYLEIVATIASKSAGMGTRNNIDEFTEATSNALSVFTKIKNTKAIIILNPAEPPITMRNTIYALIENPDLTKIRDNVADMEKAIQRYVPGYKIIVPPVFENGRVTTTLEVVGCGDYLPSYAGNLDIITCASIEIAENYAKKKLINWEV